MSEAADGPFGLVRNPIFAAMTPTALGLALMVPSALAIAGFFALVQTTDGVRYLEYAGSIGRFVPGVGRLVDR